MNRLTASQITASLAALLLATGGALIIGAGLTDIMLPVLAGVVVLIIAAGGQTRRVGAPAAASEVPDIAAHPEFHGLLEGISDPLLLIERGRIVCANRAAQRLLGAHIEGEDARIAIRHPAAAERLASLAPMAEPVMIELVGLGTREQRWQMRIAPIGDGGDGQIRRLVHLADHSGAHAAEKMRVDFVANASHELRTPLAGILGFIETLADPDLGRDSETRQRFLKIMDGEARRMQRLIDDLISLSRIEAEKYRAPETAVDLPGLVAEVVGVFRASHGDRGREVEMEIGPGPAAVQGDRAQLSQLLHNLIGNSVKYGRAGTPIRVTLGDGPSGMVRLSVADEGEGIGPDHLPRLTERFYRVDSGRSRAVGGTGLGLAICKHIVERHRGRLDIASVLGKGTSITVLLPLMPVEEKAMAAKI